jgi:hypothetical protein
MGRSKLRWIDPHLLHFHDLAVHWIASTAYTQPKRCSDLGIWNEKQRIQRERFDKSQPANILLAGWRNSSLEMGGSHISSSTQRGKQGMQRAKFLFERKPSQSLACRQNDALSIHNLRWDSTSRGALQRRKTWPLDTCSLWLINLAARKKGSLRKEKGVIT